MAERLAILAACAHEAALIRSRLYVQHHSVGVAGRLWQGILYTREVLLIQCGLGPQRAAQAVDWLAAHYPLSGLLNIGFAGGLQPDIAPGDAILVTTVLRQSDTTPPFSPPDGLRPDTRLGHIAAMAVAQAAVVSHAGALLSVPDVMAPAAVKQRLGQQTAALAVDMESYSVGQAAQRCQLPFAILRTIFDAATEDFTFPVRHCMTAEGALQVGRLGSYLVSHPPLLRYLPSWWQHSRVAGRHLQGWVKHFFLLLCQGA